MTPRTTDHIVQLCVGDRAFLRYIVEALEFWQERAKNLQGELSKVLESNLDLAKAAHFAAIDVETLEQKLKRLQEERPIEE